MPVMRYFLYVGAALIALLFVVAEAFPTLPAAMAVQDSSTSTDLTTIRIHSDRKWPERVVFDTSAPTIFPAPITIAKNDDGASKSPPMADTSTKVTAQDAFAQLVTTDLNKPSVKPQQKRKVARRRVSPPVAPTMLVAQRPQFGLFANNIW